MLSRLVRQRSTLLCTHHHAGLSTSATPGKRSALVTGGAQGLGEAISRRLARDGYSVFVADIDADLGGALADEIGGAFVQCDVRDAQSVDSAVQTVVQSVGSLDALVTSAGVVGPLVPTAEYDIEQWQKVVDVNLNGTFYSLKYALAQMVKQQTGGSVVTLSSTAGFRGMVGLGPYTASKWAVRGMTQTAAAEYAQMNIRVNGIAPTTTETPMVANHIASAADPAEMEKLTTSMNAQPGMVQPEDIAASAAFLLSEEARFITGTMLPVDAGTLTRMPNAPDTRAVQP